jgi:hypothetical protein
MTEKRFKEKLTEWAEKTTFHGIPIIATSNNLAVKFIWLIFWLASASYCSYLVFRSLLDYLKFEVDTVVEIVRDTDSEFPTVTFCNLQLCKFNDLNFQNFINIYLNQFNSSGKLSRNDLSLLLANKDSINIFEDLRNVFLTNHNQTDLIRVFTRNLTNLKNMLLSCKYGDEFCDENDFEYVELNEFEQCFKFNSGKSANDMASNSRMTQKVSNNNGLKIELFLGILNILFRKQNIFDFFPALTYYMYFDCLDFKI